MIKAIYHISGSFPADEKFGLGSQVKRASVSVASNIAEGAASRTRPEKARFFAIAKSSLSEIDARLEISMELGFISRGDYENTQARVDEISRMTEGLIVSLKRNNK